MVHGSKKFEKDNIKLLLRLQFPINVFVLKVPLVEFTGLAQRKTKTLSLFTNFMTTLLLPCFKRLKIKQQQQQQQQ